MNDAQNFVQSKLLMSGRGGKMLSAEEISKLDWSVFNDIDMSQPSAERSDALHLMMKQIDKLRK
jgi:hypothetical protein